MFDVLSEVMSGKAPTLMGTTAVREMKSNINFDKIISGCLIN